MNETIKLLAARRSVTPARLAGVGPGPVEIDQLLAIASRVPDHGRLVPWRFIVIEGDARHRLGDEIAACFKIENPDADDARVGEERRRLAHAPLVIAVVSRAAPHPKIPEWEQVLSAGAACMNLVIAANALGYSTNWLTQWFAFNRRFLDRLGLLPSERIAGFIHIGVASEAPQERPRPDLATIMSRA
jgi:nitroreductase